LSFARNGFLQYCAFSNLQYYGFLLCNFLHFYFTINSYSEEVNFSIRNYLSGLEDLSVASKTVLNEIVDFAFEEPTHRGFSDIQNKICKLDTVSEIKDEVKAYLNMRIYLSQRDGWYHKYSEYDFFIKAVRQNRLIAIDAYFEYFSNIYKSFDGVNGISANIINMLSKQGDYEEDIIDLWNIIYEIIDYRLSCREDIDWKEIETQFNDYDVEELLYMVLLARLRYGTSDVHKSVFASLERLLEDSSGRSKFVKAFKRVLSNRHNYIESSVVMLIQLVDTMYTYDEKDKYQLFKIGALVEDNNSEGDGFLLQFLLDEEMTFKSKSLVKGSNDEYNDYIINDFKRIDKRHRLLESKGISVDEYILDFFNGLHNESRMKSLSKTYMDEKSSLLMDNIQIHSDYLKTLGDAVMNYLHQDIDKKNPYKMLLWLELKEYFYNSIREDVSLLNAIHNSAILRPEDLDVPRNIVSGVTNIDKGGWIRIAYIEREYEYSEELWRMKRLGDNCKIYQVCSSVGFGNNNGLPLYIDSYRGSVLDYINPKYVYGSSGLKGMVAVVFTDATLGYNPFMSYYRYDYLSLTFEVLSLLEITLKSTHEGLIGIDKSGKCVLKYQNWCTYKNLTGEEERTPVLRGSQLLMVNSLFEKMKVEIGLEPFMSSSKTSMFDIN
jgi:hypothetical protein